MPQRRARRGCGRASPAKWGKGVGRADVDERRTVGRAAVGVFRLAVGNDDGARVDEKARVHVFDQRPVNALPRHLTSGEPIMKLPAGMKYRAG